MKKIFFSIFLLAPCFLTLASCERRETLRHYTEVVSQAASQENEMVRNDTQDDPHSGFTQEQLQLMLAQHTQQAGQETAENRIVWTVPESWEEKPSKGMRIASFVNQTDPTAIDCSIVTLGSGAGGLIPNVVRWLEQIHLPVPSEKELKQFIESQEHFKISNDVPVVLIDFTTLQKDASPSSQSMLAAIIDFPFSLPSSRGSLHGQRIFVKMTGTKQKLLENIKAFRALIQSIKLKT